ncbi:glutamine-hydrolyzing asparagine synthase [Cucurbitaria berberidis CBS 394.84]|uniref:Glutamine-hydrolyzing asparagine synthase n=1 Tax=Cucurbitaria berberidis CBS 394.84 TaxID=1168544 RepID=A0A9P4LA17_9PLEO|nr:glutamine-hydrolyzing asparagine synthase [Cucurbitaria berberidis CBS 394.84]KAF1847896.1 glutamine-hydrolyzing asparagine synthase [Cucurbitaria berberidis CBS 394.84]
MSTFSGKAIAITGAASGMGLATARLLASQGAHISVGDINTDAARSVTESLPGGLEQHMYTFVDVQSANLVNTWIEATVERFGTLNGAVNMAGIIAKAKPIVDVTDEDWDLTFAVNTRGVFNCLKAQIKAMSGVGGYSIVSAASVFGQFGAPGNSVYCARKAAVEALSKTAAKENPHIRINCVAPGSVNTPMSQGEDPEDVKRGLQVTILKRRAEPDEIANVIAFLLNESLDKIKHRGPDAKGQWISKGQRVALGHNRLAIVDLNPEAEQPFHDLDGNIHAVVNGELYGYEKIRDEMSLRGYQFRSKCDSEIAVALYKEYGLSFLSHLRGEFSLCLYDSQSQTFIAACDRYAIKPLYYTTSNGMLLIASEAKAFLPFGWQPNWDVQSIKDVGWLCDRRTIFQGVQKILPGYYLTCTSFSTVSQYKYWDLDFKDKREVETRTEKEMIQGVRERLLEAVRDRLRADVPIGVFLSGGVDSSAIAGMVKHLMDTEGAQLGTAPPSERINCFCVKFMDEEHDEEPIARRTAEWLGVKMHNVEMTEEVFATNIENAVWHNEVAVTDLGTVGKFLLSKLTSDAGIKVVLTGEGSDEHFGGYRELLTDFVREPDPSSPDSGLSEEDRIRTLKDLDGNDYSGNEPPTAATPRKQINDTSFVGFTQSASLTDSLFAPWIFDEFGKSDKRLAAVNSLDGRTRTLMANKWHPLHTSLYIWIKSTLANGLLTVLGDRCEMAHSLEGRQPFLDHRLTEYAVALPPSVKIHWDPNSRTFSEKWILKEAMRPFITDELYARKKHPFSAPVKYKPNGPVHKFFEGLITKENVERLGFLEWENCKSLVDDAIFHAERPKYSQMILVGQFIILQKGFGVKKASPELITKEQYELTT